MTAPTRGVRAAATTGWSTTITAATASCLPMSGTKTTIPERWRDIAGFEGLYQVAAGGRARSLDRIVPQRSRWGHVVYNTHRGRELKPYRTKSGRLQVVLHDAAHRRDLRFVDDVVNQAFGDQEVS
jgi:NUMOD4 motif